MYVTSGQKSLLDGFFCSAHREYGVPDFGWRQVDPKLFSGLHQSEVTPKSGVIYCDRHPAPGLGSFPGSTRSGGAPRRLVPWMILSAAAADLLECKLRARPRHTTR